jgi:hypothetical protein
VHPIGKLVDDLIAVRLFDEGATHDDRSMNDFRVLM